MGERSLKSAVEDNVKKNKYAISPFKKQEKQLSKPTNKFKRFGKSYQRNPHKFLGTVYSICIVLVSHKRLWQKIGTTKSSFPLRVIKAQSSLFQTHWRANLCLALLSLFSHFSSHLSSIEDQIGCSVFFQIQYAKAGSEWATGVGDNTHRRWISLRPGRRARSRAQPHMGTLPWLSCWWHWKMKAISGAGGALGRITAQFNVGLGSACSFTC